MNDHRPATLRAITRRALALCMLLALGAAHAGKSYTYSSSGDPGSPVTAAPVSNAPSIALMGGGYDVGEAFRWMIQQAGVKPGTGGRFLVIRATGSDAYNPYIYSELGTVDPTTPMGYENVGGKTLGLSAVETLVIPTRTAASDPFVLDRVSKANAIWIAGGNQADYYKHWKASPLESALRDAISRNIPVGGTSAGAAVLGQYAFAALNGTLTSSQALADPFNKYVTIDPLNTSSKTFTARTSFLNLPALATSITDTHLNTRDRLGRLVTFVARIGDGCTGGAESYNTVKGLGVDEETALLISTESNGTTVAKLAVNPFNVANFSPSGYAPSNSAYFVANTAMPGLCAAGVPLAYNNGGITLHRLSDPNPVPPTGAPPYASYQSGGSLDLSLWSLNFTTRASRLGTDVVGPQYYGAGGGTLLFGPTPY